ncbi:hypothetical protein N7492_009587 [Penicillium capsulatum]|uniref:Mucin family signaling protein Msb2 n=1 Tax=Penicillium capsulatum TaxID=69766 RepID=A0A9W9HXF6_9EURO|nr:hypothetical protein N7492_009587 [Penicillium capsulatum]KAJ6106975.1 hypothetical protein N7512_010492 [Penicillium capsulatum]
MRFETLSVLATFAAGLQLVAAQDTADAIKSSVKNEALNTEKPSLESRNSGGGIGSFLENKVNNVLDGNSAEPTTSSKNGKEVVVVVSQDREGNLHTLTTSTRLGSQPTDKATTSTKYHDESPAAAPATPSSPSSPSSPSASNTEDKINLGGALNILGNGASDSTTDTGSSTPATTPAAPATSPEDSNGGLGGALNDLLGNKGKSDSTTDTASSTPVTTPAAPATSPEDSNGGLGGALNDLLGNKGTSDSTTESVSSAPATSTGDSNGLLGGALNDLLGNKGKSDSTTGAVSSAPATSTGDKGLLGLDLLNKDKSDSTTGTGSSATATSTGDSKNLLEKIGDGLLGSKTTAATPQSPSVSSAASSTKDKGLLEDLFAPDKSTGSSSGTIPVSVPASPSATRSPGSNLIGDVLDIPHKLLNGTSNTQPLIPTPSLPSIPKPSSLLSGVPSLSIPLPGSPSGSTGSIPVPHAPSTGPSGKPFGFGSGASSSGSVPRPTIPVQESSNVIPMPSSTALPQSTELSETRTVAPQTTSTSTPTPTSTDSDWMPSTILVLPTHPTSESTGTDTNAPEKPTSLPGSITPNNAVEPPENSMLLQIGFDGSLPWSFVATTPLSSSQIFQFVPQALAYALPKFGSAMYALEPYYNWKQTGYNATIAVFYFPREGLDALKQLHSNPNSALYKNQDNQAVTTIMSMVDPTIPLVFNGNSPSQKGGSGSSGNDGSSDGGDNNNHSDVDGGSGSSGKGKASAAGIATGAVAGAAAYGAAMFWVARRYRKRRQLHQRTSSTGDAMSQNSAAASAAGGGSQRTARSQMISAPVMAENSLGWN